MQVEGRGIKSIKVAGRILKVMVDRARPIMLSEIAELAEINASQAHTYLTSFRRSGLVEQDTDLGRYFLGPAALCLAVGHLRSCDWQGRCLEASKLLSAELGSMVTLVGWGARGPTVVQIRDGGSNLNLNMRSGTVLAVTGTAAGRMFAAFGKSQKVNDRIQLEIERSKSDPMGNGTINEDHFQATLDKIREVGVAWAGGSPIPNVNAVCAPIFGPDGDISFAMSIVEFADLMPVGVEGPPLTRLLEVTQEISALAKKEGDDNEHN